jgi:hypothetical protein
MKILVFQASDIHISTERYPDNPVLKRVPQMVAAVRSLFLDPQQVGGCLLLCSGDVAYAGLKAEYALALPFFRELRDGLVGLYPEAEQRTLFIPGNHDCNFKGDDQARQKLIEDPDPDSLADGSIVTAATAVQNNFFEFCQQFSGSPNPAEGMDRLFSAHEFQVAGKPILVRMLNSAWTSRIHESRELTLPAQYLAAKFATSVAPAVTITTLHHPYNWFEPNNGRALRRLLEESSDLILTGHEHATSSYTKTGSVGEQNEYVEGGVLQENGDPSASSFNVLVVDLAAGTQEVHHFAWSGELYECVNEVVPQPFVRNKYRLKGEFELRPEFEESLNDPDATYTHPHKDRILLDDIFIYPDVVELDEKHSKTTTRVIYGRDLITHVLKKQKLIVTASERAGKTAVARSLFKDLRRNGKIPLMLNGRDIKPPAVKKLPALLDQAFGEQYSSKLRTRYWQLPKESRAVIVDDYHRLPITKDVRDALVRELLQRFDAVVLLAGNELRIQELMGHDRESRLLWDFAHCEVMGFGHRLRAEFIKKWYRIGREGQLEDEALVRRAIELEKTISNILGHDLLPPYPIYLLLLLQRLESNNPLDTTAASYGRLYGAVVTAYLAKSGAGEELETRINYLTELAHHLYSAKKDNLSDEDALLWHSDYCTRHLEALDYVGLRDELVRSQVLQHRNGQLRFRYRAGFFYFVAMYLSDNLAKPPIREEVKRLCGQLYREDAANIVVFLCHRSKDALILDEVLATANGLFADRAEAELLKDARFTSKLVPALEGPVLEEGDPEKNRLRALEDRDRMRDRNGGDDEDAYAHRFEEQDEDDSEVRRQMAEVNAAVKTIQIAGQILRNFGGRLDGADKLRLTEACYALGLRLMKYVYAVFEENEHALVAAARHTLQEKDKKLDAVTAREMANALVFAMLKVSTLGLIKHVSNSVGLEKLSPVFAEVLKARPTIERQLIDLSIRLDHFGAFPVDQTLQIKKKVQDSLIVLDVLRQLVFSRFYFFTAPHDVKQRVCKELDIKIQPILFDRDKKKDV